jgi:two-component system phosphate regulon response regulator PhoB
MLNPKTVLTREDLLVAVWNSTTDWQDASTVTEHVRRLRLKLENDPAAPRHLVTVRGHGYRFEP